MEIGGKERDREFVGGRREQGSGGTKREGEREREMRPP